MDTPHDLPRWDDRQVYPNFLIVGAAKAGTTSLYEYLREHPQVYMPSDPRRKEPHYFVHDKVANYQELPAYLALFEEGRGCKAIGEASTGYLYAPESPRWIQNVLGPIRIVIVLRNPVRRAESLWGWMVRGGFEPAATFEEALALESERFGRPEFEAECLEIAQNYAYFRTGLYADQVERYFNTFGREQVRVVIFEEFVRDPLAACRDLFQFLEVDDAFQPTIQVHNQGGRVPRFIGLQHRLQAIAMGHRPAHWMYAVPRKRRAPLLRALKRWNLRFGRRQRTSKDVLARLTAAYSEDIDRLEGLLRRDLSIWRHGKSMAASKIRPISAPVGAKPSEGR